MRLREEWLQMRFVCASDEIPLTHAVGRCRPRILGALRDSGAFTSRAALCSDTGRASGSVKRRINLPADGFVGTAKLTTDSAPACIVGTQVPCAVQFGFGEYAGCGHQAALPGIALCSIPSRRRPAAFLPSR